MQGFNNINSFTNDGKGTWCNNPFKMADLALPTLLVCLLLSYVSLYAAGIIRHDNCDDRQIFEYIGWSISQGAVPYLQNWDNKGPIIFLFNALGYWICPNSDLGIEILSAGMFCAALCALFFVCRFFSRRSIATVMVLAMFAWHLTFIDSGGLNTSETLYIVLSALSLILMLKLLMSGKSQFMLCFLIGVLAVLPMWIKPNYFGLICFHFCVIVGLGLCGVNRRKILYRLLAYVAGIFGCSAIIVFVSLFVFDNFTRMMDAMLYYNLYEYEMVDQYFSHPFLRTFDINIPIPAWAKEGFILKHAAAECINIFIFACMCPLFVLAYLYSMWHVAKVHAEKFTFSPKIIVIISSALWFALELAACCVKFNTFKHYYAILGIPAFLIMAYACSLLTNKWKRWGIYCCVFCTFVAYLPYTVRNMVLGEVPLCAKTIRFLSEHHDNGAKIPTFGEARICQIMRKCRIVTAQNYSVNSLFLYSNISIKRKNSVEEDFFDALVNNASKLFVSIVPKENIPFKSRPVQEELSRYSLIFAEEGVYIYSLDGK